MNPIFSIKNITSNGSQYFVLRVSRIMPRRKAAHSALLFNLKKPFENIFFILKIT